ncbi:unnamed protein product, partial [Protopolystoma xenopodis]
MLSLHVTTTAIVTTSSILFSLARRPSSDATQARGPHSTEDGWVMDAASSSSDSRERQMSRVHVSQSSTKTTSARGAEQNDLLKSRAFAEAEEFQSQSATNSADMNKPTLSPIEQ